MEFTKSTLEAPVSIKLPHLWKLIIGFTKKTDDPPHTEILSKTDKNTFSYEEKTENSNILCLWKGQLWSDIALH